VILQLSNRAFLDDDELRLRGEKHGNAEGERNEIQEARARDESVARHSNSSPTMVTRRAERTKLGMMCRFRRQRLGGAFRACKGISRASVLFSGRCP
jgi:hypothetical protein